MNGLIVTTLLSIAILGAIFAPVLARRSLDIPTLDIPTIDAGSGITAQAQSKSVISLGWMTFGHRPKSYYIYRDGRKVGVATAESQNFQDRNLLPKTTYNYDIYADLGGNGFLWGGRTAATTLAASPLYSVTTFEQDVTVASADLGGWTKIAKDKTKISATTERARAGHKSVKFTFLYSDWAAFPTAHERTQITNGVGNVSIFQRSTIGKDYWVGFSTFLDESWQPDNDQNQDSIWQFHGESLSPGNWTSPLGNWYLGSKAGIAFKGHPTNIYDCATFTGPTPAGYTLYTYDITHDIGRWVDWVIKANFAYTHGTIDVWRNGVHVVSFSGSTLYHCNNQKLDRGPYFGPVGPYKWNWGVVPTLVRTRVMYMDEIRIGGPSATCAEVKPEGAQPCAQ
jgi:hypothetical protein